MDWTAAWRAGLTPKAPSARSTTACRTWCRSALPRPSSPTNGAWRASPSTVRCGAGWAGWCVFSTRRPRPCGWAASISRLAGQDKHYFEGLPSPSAAAIVAALVWLANDQTNIGLPGLILAFLVTATAGALMISRFAFNSFKYVNPSGRVRFTYIVFVPLAFILIFLHPAITLLIIF